MNKILISIGCVAALAGCGGGSTSDTVSNGTYQAFSADGRNFPLALDFTKLTYSYTVNGVARSGSLALLGNELFRMSNPTGETTETSLITVGDNIASGAIRVGTRLVPFVAAKTFVTALTEVPGKYSAMVRDTSSATETTTTPVRWTTYRVDAVKSNVTYCSGTAQGTVAGNNPLLDADACPSGTTTVIGTLATTTTPGVFVQTDRNAVSEVRFAKSGADVYMLSTPVQASLQQRTFVLGMAGTAADYRGTWIVGADTNGAGVNVIFPSVSTVTFSGGSTAAPGSVSTKGDVAAVASAANALRFTPAGATAPVGGFIMSANLGVYGDFTKSTGDLTLFIR